MKNIAIFQRDLMAGGIQKSLINTLNVIPSSYKVDLYLYDKSNFFEDKIPSNVNIIYIKNNKLMKLLPFSLYKKLRHNYVLDKEYDVAIDFNGYQNDGSFGTIMSNSKKKVIYIHNDLDKRLIYDKKYRYLFKMGKSKYKYFDNFVFVSKGALDAFKKVYDLPSNVKTHIIANQIDDSIILEKAKEKCDIKVDSKKYNIVTVGRLVYAKGFDLLLQDLKRLLEYRKDFHLYFVGDGSEKTNLEKLTNDLGLNDYVTFLGQQNNPYKYMTLMDGFALTSRYEGQGMVIMEAKVLGLELFCTKLLESYNAGELTGYDDIVDGLKNAKKRKKVFYSLDDYNQRNKDALLKLLK